MVVLVISILLITNIVLTYYNNSIIQKNRNTQLEVQKTKIFYDQIGRSVIHAFDIGLRGFAIVKDKQFLAPLDSGLKWKDSILHSVERPLKKLNYNFYQYNIFKDSLNDYARYCQTLSVLLQKGDDHAFTQLFMQDKGRNLWWQYIRVEKHITAYLNRLAEDADQQYDAALLRNQMIQIILFLISVPTLLYTAFYTTRTFKLSELLRQKEADNNKILQNQNIILEQKVSERTQEIILQSEELAAQRDALEIQNTQLHEAQKTIEIQNNEIQSMNQQLQVEVNNRTHELREANKQLVDQNNQLEQFAFIAAHNLRAPLTRILGLSNVIEINASEADQKVVLQKLIVSVKELDQVIRDLNTILNIKKHTGKFEEVDLEEVAGKVMQVLEKEIESTHTVLTRNFREVTEVYAINAYVESILYNLISNAIKFRDPGRIPFVTLETSYEADYICLTVSDNGLGIDLKKHDKSIFSLYKRFHLHMEGRGLGLYLVKTQIQALGGKIEVRSFPNEGTTFFVYFKRYLI
jgi:signal transduction histidine kinase